LDSFFNENGTGIIGGDGIRFFDSTIASGLVTLHDPSMTLTTGFTLKNSQVVGNSDDGVEFDGVTAIDVTFTGDTIAANNDDGVFIIDSDVNDLAIQNSFLAPAANPL